MEAGRATNHGKTIKSAMKKIDVSERKRLPKMSTANMYRHDPGIETLDGGSDDALNVSL